MPERCENGQPTIRRCCRRRTVDREDVVRREDVLAEEEDEQAQPDQDDGPPMAVIGRLRHGGRGKGGRQERTRARSLAGSALGRLTWPRHACHAIGAGSPFRSFRQEQASSVWIRSGRNWLRAKHRRDAAGLRHATAPDDILS